MRNVKKAARGKRRWIGIKIEGNTKILDEILENYTSSKLAWRSNDAALAIVGISLVEYNKFLSDVAETKYLESISSSGKIRLVKMRLGIV